MRRPRKSSRQPWTVISPGGVNTDLKHGSSDAESLKSLDAFYEIAIGPDAIARAVAYAVEQPADVDISEIAVRPTAQDF